MPDIGNSVRKNTHAPDNPPCDPQDPVSRLSILHTEWSTGWGGQEIRILSEMQALRDQHGYTFHLACRPDARIGEEAASLGFTVHKLPFRGRFDWHTIWQLRFMVRQHRIDLLHAHSSIDAYCAGLCGRLCGIPVVRSRHLSIFDKPGFKLRLVYDWLAQAVICSSEQTRSYLINEGGCRPQHKVTIRAGADPQRFHPDCLTLSARSGSDLRHELGLPEQAPVIGIVAMLRLKKGHVLLLQAFSALRAEWPQARLLIVGEGPARDTIETTIKELHLESAVLLTGYRTDVPQLMKLMAVCVTPSFEEACSQVVMQAMQAGTPVIVSSAGGLPELVKHLVTGQVFENGNAMALNQALTFSLDNPEKLTQMAAAARLVATGQFSIQAQMAATAQLYESVVVG
jgi:glycosyltransferase involved in cell wall biosynthesis